MSASKETEVLLGRPLWQQWLVSWALVTFWLGLMGPLVAATCYGIKKPSDFDPALRLLPVDKFLWSARVGSASCGHSSGAIKDSFFGVNAENPGFEQARNEVWNGTLRETKQATYLAWLRSSHWPTVFTVYRRVRPNGEISYGAWQNGSKPIADYLLYCVTLGVVATVLVEVVGARKEREKRQELRAS